jgi:hypothetical protein
MGRGWDKNEDIKNDPRYLEPLISQIRKAQIKTLRNTVTLPSDSSQVTIGIETYSKTLDILFVFANSTWIMVGQDFAINQDGTGITSLNGTWQAGTIFNFIVMKNIEVDANVVVTNGSQLADNSVGNRKLEPGIKLGSLSDLYTLDKSSYANAINELVLDIGANTFELEKINTYLDSMKKEFSPEEIELNIYVDRVNGSDSYEGSEVRPYRTIQKALDSIPGVSARSRTINVYVAAGTYSEDLIMRNKFGGRIYLYGNEGLPTSVKFKSLFLEDVFSYFRVGGFQATTTNQQGIFFERCAYATTAQCIVDGNKKTGGFSGVLYSASRGRVQGSTLSNNHNGIAAIYGSQVAIDSDNKGTGNTYGIRASRSTLYKEGANQISGTAKEGVLYGGIISNGGIIGG